MVKDREKRRVCFLVNPLAGIGGPLALKGSDGEAGLEALRRGARLVAPERARVFLRSLPPAARRRVLFLTAGGLMGLEEARAEGVEARVVYEPRGWPTTPLDTVEAVRACVGEGAELVVFVGGDGTARDVVRGLAEAGAAELPVLGVPGGVKMYSSVFASSPAAAAAALAEWLEGRASRCRAEVMDIDEEAFRRGVLRVRLYGYAYTLCSGYMVGSSKQVLTGYDEEENKHAIARYVAENMEECTLYVLGPGTTVKAVAEELGVPKTELGVDVVHNGHVVALDVDEETLYRLVAEHRRRGGRVRIVVSPIGGQGFILGRGNQQISPRVLRAAGGKEALIVLATEAKLASTGRRLRVDTGDEELDRMLSGYIRVVTDYGVEEVVPVEAYTSATGGHGSAGKREWLSGAGAARAGEGS